MNGCYIFYDGKQILVRGVNNSGQLGLGDNNNRDTLTVMMEDTEIRQIACGGYHTFILKNNGELFVFGYNRNGQLGLGDNTTRNVPTLLMRDPNVKQIVCGLYYSFILKNNGEVYAFGENNWGQLGLGDYDDRNIPCLVMRNDDIKQIFCGSAHTFILKNNGELFSFGYNNSGQLGLGDYEHRNVPILVTQIQEIEQIICGRDRTFILKRNGELFAFGCNNHYKLGLYSDNIRSINTPTLIIHESGIKQIIPAAYHTLVLKNNGALFVNDINSSNRFDQDDNCDAKSSTLTLSLRDIEIRQIVCSWDHIFILKNNGSLFVSDNNYYGKLAQLNSSDDNNNNMNELTFIMTNENIISVNGITVEKIVWNVDIFHTLSTNKRKEIFSFMLVCHYYKTKLRVNMVKYMRQMIVSLLF